MLVFDFDGTLTDAEAEGAPYYDGYLRDLEILTGAARGELDGLVANVVKEISAEPGQFGWKYNGVIVAPAAVDPYLRVMPIARRILDHYGVFAGPERDRLLDGILYKYNYTKTRNVFRDGAARLLARAASASTYIVTNSHTDAVVAKVQDLARDTPAVAPLAERVLGGAKKYVVDNAYDRVDETMTIPGLERPIYLRRGRYGATLDRLLTTQAQTFEDLCVVGDIFELDLSLPLALGARAILVANHHTPPYEIDFMTSHERGYVAQSLGDVERILEELAIFTR